MKKMILFSGFLCLVLMSSQLHAQSINNRNWVASFGDPINDSLTLHIQSDSSFVATSKGDVIIHTTCTVKGDTLTILDHGGGEHECPDMKGTYKINLAGNTLTLTTIDDACEGRGQALNGTKWTEVPKVKSQK